MSRIAVGDKIPEGELSYIDEDNSLKKLSIAEFAAGKKIVLFGVPGAFTPTCSIKHVPGFLENGPALKAKGVSAILCITVNDPFVVNAWSKTYPTNTDIIKFLADGSGTYTKALGLELDLTAKGLGVRSERFALLIDDLEVKVANIESGGAFEVSSAEDILKALA
ncbi:glutaredoxin-dependent peroxiredoxin [Marchantia polymorpha subsp. ruderalis]